MAQPVRRIGGRSRRAADGIARRTADVLVLGGGPAGAAFATLAARGGASVVLVERRGYDDPRPGEHLSGRVRGALDALGVTAPDTGAFVTSSPGIVSLWSGGPPLTKPYVGASPPALRVVRNRFDRLLFEAATTAGVAAFAPARALRFTRERGRAWRVRIELDGTGVDVSASLIVDASGRASAFARTRGAGRINRGDLFAIVGWLTQAEPSRPNAGMLIVEAAPLGWWSASMTGDGALVASLYTSAAMMKAERASADAWWERALGGAPYVGELIGRSGAVVDERRVYPAFPSIARRMHGPGWIAIGEAAVAFDPLCGQGVAYALESAFRAYEAVSIDGDWSALARIYQEVLTFRFEEHLAKRAEVYEEAGDILSEMFFEASTSP